MEPAVKEQLLAMTADFYRFHADSFDESRQSPWQSWERVLTEVNQIGDARSVVDAGCGNGRFVSFLHENGYKYDSYVGLDTEELLIRKARERYVDETFDLGTVEDAIQCAVGVDLAVCFGVFHHLPGAEYRADVLNAFCKALRPNGVLAISLWQPKLLKNFASKIKTGVDVADIEHDDFFMGWSGDTSHLRYCHNFSDAEIDELVTQSGFDVVATFHGVGNDMSNRYLVLR